MAEPKLAELDDFQPEVLDILADFAADLDEGPSSLDVVDEPDPNPDRIADPKPEDGLQSVSQNPDDYEPEE
jgi:hypothetical protein